MRDTEPLLKATDFPSIYRSSLTTLQINLGYLCNLSCTHCHVNAGPKRTELMSKATIDEILNFIDVKNIKSIDLTGGAPEMNPDFKYFVREARRRNCEVIDRCNLTILLEPGYEDMAMFLAEEGVRVVASLPCYEEENVNEQRGKGVYQSSIEALQRLNSLGYGKKSSLPLDLVYNPNGAFLPPPQQSLEAEYKQQLSSRHDITFNELLTITNMPISRFGSVLLAHDQFDDYISLLKDNFSEHNLSNLMCKSLISIDWLGNVYDCDFNQMLGWGVESSNDKKIIGTDRSNTHITELLNREMLGDAIVIGQHCYGCTAGQGSSCSGALDE
jgi:radical SAM/Cys-rich protein